MQILLLSEIFLTAEILNAAFEKINILPETTITGSASEVKKALEKKDFSIVIIDSYVLRSICPPWLKTIIQIYKHISFILISYDATEEEIFTWLDLGFSGIVNNSPLELAIAIKKEMKRIVQVKENLDLEKKLNQSSQFLKLILDHVPAGIFWKDIDSNYLGCNKLHANAMHFNKADDIIGKSDSDFHYSPEKLELFKEDDLRVITDNRQISRITQYEFQNPNGKIIWTETNKVPIHNEYGDVIGILGLYKDITNSMLLERELREREIHYRTIMENLSEGVIVYDSKLNIINCNSSAEKITGYNLHQLIDGEYKKTGAILIDEKGDLIKKNDLPHFITRDKGVVCSNVIIGFRYKDNRLQWIRFNTVPIFKEDSKLNLIVSTLVDITDNIKNQQRLQEKELLYTHIFSAMSEAIVVLNQKRELVVSNPSGQRLLNFVNQCKNDSGYLQFVNEDLFEISKEDYPSNITISSGLPCKDRVMGIRVNAKEYIWLLVNTQPIFAPDSAEVVMVVISSLDITEKKQIAHELFIKKKMEAIGNIASTIVHDFNNILQPIMFFSSILQRELSKLNRNEQVDKLIEHASKIYKGTTRGKEMIHQILKVSQKKNEPYQNIDLVEIIKETINEIQIIKPDSIRIQFRTKLNSAKLEASPANIHQIIFNLCNNSIYAMKQKADGILYLSLNKIIIDEKIKTKLFYSKNPFAYELIIKDEGTGIKQENLDRIFEPYFTTKQEEGGTGLGLTSVYSIIQNLHGSISVVSKENVGTMFTIYLPSNES